MNGYRKNFGIFFLMCLSVITFLYIYAEVEYYCTYLDSSLTYTPVRFRGIELGGGDVLLLGGWFLEVIFFIPLNLLFGFLAWKILPCSKKYVFFVWVVFSVSFAANLYLYDILEKQVLAR